MEDKATYVYDGYHKIEQVQSVIKGKEVTREKLLLPSAVGGLVINEDNKIALVTQYRPTVGLTTKEIPAGVLDKGITNIATLVEELEEECGITKKDIVTIDKKPIFDYYMVTGSSDAKMVIYEVHVKEQEDKDVPDDHDVESVEWLTLAQIEEYVRNGQIVDSKTLLAYEYAKRELN